MTRSAEQLGLFRREECRLERPVLRDPALQEEFDRRGYVVVPLLDPDEVRTLYDGYARAAARAEGLNEPGAYNDTYAEFSVIHSRPSFRREAYDLICPVVTPKADRYLQDYRPLIANFVNKPPGTGVVPAHQNWSVVDESQYQSVSVWVALVDCQVENGAMSMYDGSHLDLRGRRGIWAYAAFAGIEDDLISEVLTPIEVKAGDAVILDDALVHYSPPNLTDDRRLAIQFVMVPEEADTFFFQAGDASDGCVEVDQWRVDAPFFFEFIHGERDPDHAELVERLELPEPSMDLPTLRHLVEGIEPAPEAATDATDAEVQAPDANEAAPPRKGRLLDWLRSKLSA